MPPVPSPKSSTEKSRGGGSSCGAYVDAQPITVQIFLDTFRFERDFFYDPGMHGLNWNAMKERYGTLLEDAVSRWDVNWVNGPPTRSDLGQRPPAR